MVICEVGERGRGRLSPIIAIIDSSLSERSSICHYTGTISLSFTGNCHDGRDGLANAHCEYVVDKRRQDEEWRVCNTMTSGAGRRADPRRTVMARQVPWETNHFAVFIASLVLCGANPPRPLPLLGSHRANSSRCENFSFQRASPITFDFALQH